MTKKIAISVPDDVAERLAQEPNVSAFVTESVRQRMAGERTRRALRQVGFRLSDGGLADAGHALDEAQAKITPELRARAAALLSESSRGRLTRD
ncbi:MULTISPECIES: hypothetical protein [unclassified Micromonospora]|uniref:hypothetical protein n=1 Tax=unclassified Micromonospora TaxID=2617518 RepID=UPI001C23F838|nr:MULTISPECIES: hypothetical protein [unclassified Micromonospora]MBU8856634.1 hypothetical protein [Micromonospora sp. WMMB482]MDM4782248.1 hypothetical protein [Micromonospora sp. b486]